MRHSYGGESDQWIETFVPDGPSVGIAVIVHGGFWRSRYDASLGEPLAADLAARGWTACNIEYRRVHSGGGWPNTFHDVADAIDSIADLGLDLTRVVAIGHSAGGHLATWAAYRPHLTSGTPGSNPRVRLTGVVSQAGVLDLRTGVRERVGGTAITDFLGGGVDEVPTRYEVADPMSHVPLSVPIVCVHSREDDSVPFQQSVAYVNAARTAGGDAELMEVLGDHMAHIVPTSSAWAATLRALSNLATRTE